MAKEREVFVLKKIGFSSKDTFDYYLHLRLMKYRIKIIISVIISIILSSFPAWHFANLQSSPQFNFVIAFIFGEFLFSALLSFFMMMLVNLSEFVPDKISYEEWLYNQVRKERKKQDRKWIKWLI